MKKRFRLTIKTITGKPSIHLLWEESLDAMKIKADHMLEGVENFKSYDIDELDEDFETTVKEYYKITGGADEK